MKKKILAFLLAVIMTVQMCLPVLATENKNIYMIEVISTEELPENLKKPEESQVESQEEVTDSQEEISEELPEQAETEEQAAEVQPEEPEEEVNAVLSMKKSTDGGIHWSEAKILDIREKDIEEEAFEAAAIEAADVLYLFTNYGYYYFSKDAGVTWSERQAVGGFSAIGCELLVSSYYEPADKTISIFLTLATEEEQECKTLGYLVQEDGTLLWSYAYVEVEEGAFYEAEKENAESAPEITQHSDRTVAMVSSVLIDEKASGVLHHHNETAVVNSVAGSFAEENDETAFIENAEFTFTQIENGWNIHNQYENVYLDLDAPDNYYGEAEAPIHIESAADGCYRIRRAYGSYAVFNSTNMTFDRWDVLAENDEYLKYDFTLLKWSEEASGEQVLPGYVKASAMEDGGSYLITYIREDGVFILYPTAPQNAQTKLCTIKEAEKKGVVTIIGVETGMTTAVVDGVTYEINVVPPTVPKSAMKVTTGSQQSEEESGKHAIDGDESTIWHSSYDRTADQGYDDLWIQIALDDVYAIDEVYYVPSQSDINGTITRYKLLISVDGQNWAETLPKDWAEDSTQKVVRLATPVNAKYIKLQALDSVSEEGKAVVSAAEIRLIGVLAEDEIY